MLSQKGLLGIREIRWSCRVIYSQTLVKHMGKIFFFFPSTYSVSLELKLRKEHGGLTEPSQGNTFLYQIMKKKQWKHTHTKQKPTFTRFFFYSICLAVIYRRPLKWDCLRKKSKGHFSIHLKGKCHKKNKTKKTTNTTACFTCYALLSLVTVLVI